ncbi:MAG: PilZ domain-containing protein [Isosphaerales bacterium]
MSGPEMGDQTPKATGSSTDQKNRTPRERRRSTRYTLRDTRGRLSWGEGTERRMCDVTVVNISGGGAAVYADPGPTVDHTVWLWLEAGSAETEPWEARVVATTVDPSGKHFVRLQFTSWVALDAILERHQERRLWERYPPARETLAILSWDDQGVQGAIRGELLNISGGGAAVITEIEPPGNIPLWFELEIPAIPIVAVEARLVVFSLDPSGTTVARLRFVNSCPMELFELAVHGSL